MLPASSSPNFRLQTRKILNASNQVGSGKAPVASDVDILRLSTLLNNSQDNINQSGTPLKIVKRKQPMQSAVTIQTEQA